MSVYKPKNSKYWYARYKNHEGKWVAKSTGSKNKAVAQQIERGWFDQATKNRELGLPQINTISLANFIPLYESKRLSSRSPKTVSIDKRSLLGLLSLQNPGKLLSEITSQDISNYKSRLKIRGLSPFTINKRLRAIGTAFNWAIKNGFTRRNPVKDVDKLKTPQTLPLEIPKEDVRSLIDASSEKWIGDYIRAAAYGGFRSSEITGISVDDIDFKNKFVSVIGKFNKQRYVPLFPSLNSLFTEILGRSPDEDLRYLRRSGHDGREGGKLFYQVAHSSVVYHAYKSIIQEKWPNDRKRNQYRFHDLRHTFATNYLRNGGSLEKLRKILGHEKIQTTLIYEHLLVDDLQEDEDPVKY